MTAIRRRVLAVVLTGLVAGSAGAMPSRFAPAGGAIKPGHVRVETLTGEVTAQARPTAVPVHLRVGMQLPEGTIVRTGVNGRVFLRFSATDVVRLSPRTEIKLTQVKTAAKPGRTMTILTMATGRARAMLKRLRPSPAPDFAFTAGGSICAVKGTDFEERVESAANGTVTVTLRVDSGSVLMLNAMAGLPGGIGLSVDDVGQALSRGLGAVPVRAGQGTTSEGGGPIAPASRVPPRTSLEIIATTPGTRVLITVNGVTTEAVAGDEVPPGAKVQVSGGDAVLSSGGNAVAASDGATFTYTAAETPASAAGGAVEVRVVIVVADGSSGVGVESGDRTVDVAGGSGVVTGGAAGPMVMTDDAANVAADAINAPDAPPAVPDAVPAPGTLEPTPPPVEDQLPGSSNPLPDLPTLGSDGAAPPPASDDAPPPPPPDTVNQDVPTVSPAAP